MENTGWKSGWTIRTYAVCWTSLPPNCSPCAEAEPSPTAGSTERYSTSGKTSENSWNGNYRDKKRYDYDTHTAQRREPRSHPLFPSFGIPRRPMGKNKEKYRPILNGERYLTEAELSGLLKVTQRTLIEHRTNGKLPFYKFGGRILYKESDIIRILEQNRMEAFKTG